MSTPLRDSLVASFQHLELLQAKVDKLHQARDEAETQVLHRIACAYRSGEITYDQLADVAQDYAAAAGDGKTKRWLAATGVPLSALAADRRNRPNGPHGSWMGQYPLERGEPRPRPGTFVVYVLFDSEIQPCYVGSTGTFTDRLRAHYRDGKRWSHWTAWPCETREAAYALEGQVLREHLPYLNLRRSA